MSALTKLEKEFLEILERNNCEDYYNCSEGFSYFSIKDTCDAFGLDTKVIRGVVASLLRKEIISEQNEEHGVQYFGYEFKERGEV